MRDTVAVLFGVGAGAAMLVMQALWQLRQVGRRPYATPRAARLDVALVGPLVPRSRAAWRVHSVFAHACNFRCGELLLTLVDPRSGGGPTTLVLRHPPARNMDCLFEVGEVVSARAPILSSRRVVLSLEHAELWRPRVARALLPSAHIEANLALAGNCLIPHRRNCASVIESHGRPLVSALARATRGLDRDEALRIAERLVGWGEGLTPAGDDFLVGWMAGLDALEIGAQRRQFRGAFKAALARLATGTTPIAAHFLRLAAAGHYVEVLDRVRDALLCEPDPDSVRRAVDAALDVGATSGADMLSGLLLAIEAWLPAAAVVGPAKEQAR